MQFCIVLINLRNHLAKSTRNHSSPDEYVVASLLLDNEYKRFISQFIANFNYNYGIRESTTDEISSNDTVLELRMCSRNISLYF